MGSGILASEPTNHGNEGRVLSAFHEVGKILAEARQERNLTIKQVASIIHIRQRYLTDLEEGHLSDLPGRVYILGFIRTYARFLDLDGEELIRRVNLLSSLPSYEHGQIPTPLPSQESPSFSILIVSTVLVGVIAVGGYVFLKPSSPLYPQALDASVDKEKITQAETDKLFTDFLEKESALEEEPLEFPQHKTLPPLGALESLTQSPALRKVTLKAAEPTWIEIRDAKGRILFMKVLQAGDVYDVPDMPGVTINTGNAGGLDVFVGETKLPSLGKHGDIKRGISVESLQ